MPTKTATKRDPLPKRLLVYREGEGDDEYFAVSETPDDAAIEHGVVVGVYELVETKTMRVTRELK